MKKLLTCFVLTISLSASAQISPQAVIERMNQSLLALEKGEYRADYRFKSFLKTDTSSNSGLVRYFKTSGGVGDTLARFMFWPTKGPVQGSDGETYFYVIKDSVIATENVRQHKGLIKHLSKGDGARSRLLSLPILTNHGHTPIDPEKWSMAKIGQFALNDTAFLELYQRRMFPIKTKLTPTAKDSMIYTEQWLLYPDSYTPRRVRTWADQQDGHIQFEEINYTNIRPLPPEISFETEYNVAEMLANGYRTAEIDPNARKKRPEVSIGDSIPNIMVRLETGDTLPLFEAYKQRYLVLDFWYRSCAPCNLAMPGLSRANKALLGKDVAVVALNPIDKQYDKLVDQYKGKYGYTFPIAFTERANADAIKILGYPTLLVVDRQTRKVIQIASTHSEAQEKSLLAYLEGLLR